MEFTPPWAYKLINPEKIGSLIGDLLQHRLDKKTGETIQIKIGISLHIQNFCHTWLFHDTWLFHHAWTPSTWWLAFCSWLALGHVSGTHNTV